MPIIATTHSHHFCTRIAIQQSLAIDDFENSQQCLIHLNLSVSYISPTDDWNRNNSNGVWIFRCSISDMFSTLKSAAANYRYECNVYQVFTCTPCRVAYGPFFRLDHPTRSTHTKPTCSIVQQKDNVDTGDSAAIGQ